MLFKGVFEATSPKLSHWTLAIYMGYSAGVLFVFFCILHLKGRDQKEEKIQGSMAAVQGRGLWQSMDERKYLEKAPSTE